MVTNKARISKAVLLVALCWLVYTASYLGKLGYSANITQIENVYGVSHASAGMVSTFFFFAYGLGQIISGVLCKRFNLRFIVFAGLVVSGLMNLLVGVVDNFELIKYFWLINGAVLSVLWTSLVRLISENLDEADFNKTIIILGTTVPVGTIIVYGLSSLLVALGNYIVIFYIAAAVLPIVALLWVFFYPFLLRSGVSLGESEVTSDDESVKPSLSRELWISICILAFFAVAVNLVKDGLTTWVPMILKETYDLPDYAGILLTLLLPILAIFGTGFAISLNKRIKDLVLLSVAHFLMASVLIAVVILCLPTTLIFITLGCFGVISLLMSGINNIVTTMVPLYWKDRLNPGLWAGVFNGFCYIGSTISAYGLGAIADAGGWSTVIWLLFGLCMLAAVLGFVGFLFNRPCAKSHHNKV